MKRIATTLAALALAAVAAPAFAQTPQARATAGGTLRLDTRISHEFVPVGSPTTVHATVRVSGADVEVSGERAPLNVALVVDRSTSMSGGKFEQAIRASHLLVDMLGPNDRLAIVSYGSDVSTMSSSLLATSANKELLHNAVAQIRLSGSTNLSGGLQRGMELIVPHNRDETINRVLLLSDGHANAGVTTVEGLSQLAARGLERGVSLTTMGIGLDYNENIMTAMAKNGAGNYYFIENEEAIAGMFRQEWNGLASTVARNTVLKLKTAPGVELLSVHGFASSTKGDTTTIKLSEFYARQEKDVLVELAVSPQGTGSRPIMTSRLTFDDVTQDDKRVSSSVTVAAVATDDPKQLAKVDRDVVRRAQQVETARSMEKAMAEYEKGNEAKAAKIVAEQRVANRQFQKQYDFEDDEAFGRVDGELESMEKDVRSTRSGSTEGKRMRKAKKARAYEIGQTQSLF